LVQNRGKLVESSEGNLGGLLKPFNVVARPVIKAVARLQFLDFYELMSILGLAFHLVVERNGSARLKFARTRHVVQFAEQVAKDRLRHVVFTY
jgi:hypothetical protein